MKALSPTKAAASALLCLNLFVPALAFAQTALTAQDCLAVQMRASATACAAVAKCYSKAMRTGVPVSSACVGLAKDVLATAAGTAESHGNCLVKGEARSVADMIATGNDDLATSLTLTGGHCASMKMGGLGKACKDFLRCNATADANSTPLDPACIASRAARLTRIFPKLEAGGKCATTGDLTTLEGKVAHLVDSIQMVFRGTGTTTTSSTATTL